MSPSAAPRALLELLAGCERATRAAGAAAAEVSYEGGVFGFARFATSRFTQTGVAHEPLVRVRAMTADGRMGAALAASLDPALLVRTGKRAVVAAEAAPPPAGPIAGFATPGPTPGPAPLAAQGSVDAATAEAGPDERAELCARLFAHAAEHGLVMAGALHSGVREIAVVTSGGVALHHRFSETAVDCIALRPGASGLVEPGAPSGFGRFASGRLSRLDAEAVAARAAYDAVRMADPQDVEPGPLDVVLAPPAVAEMLEWLSLTSLGARALLDGGSLLCEREKGSTLVDERITLEENPAYDHPDLVRSPFDAEGTPRRAVTFLAAGRVGSVVTDRQTALDLGDAAGSTGHTSGLTAEFSEGPGPAHLVLHPGTASTAELVAQVERGLLVSRFHYVNGYLDTRRAAMTGMTRDGLFRIVDGRIVGAARPLRWTDSLLDALTHRLGGVGRELEASRTSWSRLGMVLAPALLLRGWRFTGRSR